MPVEKNAWKRKKHPRLYIVLYSYHIKLWHDDTFKESEPYVAFQSQHPYDNAVCMRWFNTVLTCTAFPGLHKHHTTQSCTNPLHLTLMRPLLTCCEWITPIICEYIRLHGTLSDSVVFTCNTTVAHREKLCWFSPAAQAHSPDLTKNGSF